PASSVPRQTLAAPDAPGQATPVPQLIPTASPTLPGPRNVSAPGKAPPARAAIFRTTDIPVRLRLHCFSPPPANAPPPPAPIPAPGTKRPTAPAPPSENPHPRPKNIPA